MPRFRYQARDGQGASTTGVISADSAEAAGLQLRTEGKFIVKIMPVTATSDDDDKQTKAKKSGRVKKDDVIMFVHQLAVMLDTGVPMSEALECASEQCVNPAFKFILADITNQVQSGTDLSSALRRYPKVFPNLMTALIRASEVSGTMGTMLERLASYMTKEQQTLKQARGALTYPLFMLCMAVSVTIFLLAVILPKFAKIYEGKGAVLPGPTRFLMASSDLLVNYWYLWLVGAVAVGVGGVMFVKTTPGRRCLDWIKLNVPISRTLFNKLYITRSTRTMGTMINAGVSMLDMIAIIKHVTNNVYYEELWTTIEDRITQGSQLSDPMFESKLIPRSIAQMIYSGEKSGRLGQVMERIASFTESEFDTAVKTTTQFIEPLMIGVMGAVIGFIAISLLMPIFSVGRVMAGGG